MQAFNKIREPDPTGTTTGRILVSTGISIFGFLIGIFQKWLDSMAVNELPALFQKLDLTNYFGRLAVWSLLASAIAVCAKSPRRASLNCFLFFACMLAGYYLYCQLVLGFLPVSYMMVWAGMAVAGDHGDACHGGHHLAVRPGAPAQAVVGIPGGGPVPPPLRGRWCIVFCIPIGDELG